MDYTTSVRQGDSAECFDLETNGVADAMELPNQSGILPKRGYFGIGIENTKTEMNIGTLWRSASLLGAAFIFTIKRRYHKQSSDTMASHRHIPLYHYDDFDSFYQAMPYDCQLVGLELTDASVSLSRFKHPERAIYLLGAEDHGLTSEASAKCHKVVQIPTLKPFSLNVSVAGSIVMYDRVTK